MWGHSGPSGTVPDEVLPARPFPGLTSKPMKRQWDKDELAE